MAKPPFQIVTDTPAPRAPGLLVRDPVQFPGHPDPLIPYDFIAPGLYPDEKVFQLDTGEEIALSVSTARKPSGAGMEFTGWARVITGDGTTLLDAAGEEMEIEFRHIVTMPAFAALDDPKDPAEARIGREIMLLMLGADPTMVPVHVDPNAPVPVVAADDEEWDRYRRNPTPGLRMVPPSTVLEPAAKEAPLVAWSDEVRMNASVREHLKMFRRAQPEVDVAALLAKG